MEGGSIGDAFEQIAQAIEDVLKGPGSSQEKLLAAVRLRHSATGVPTARSQMAMASISPATYKRISKKADALIERTGFAYTRADLPIMPRTPGSDAVYVKQPIDQKMRWQVFRRDGYACQECGELEDLTVDHIVPEKNGGRAVLDNLRTLCRPCNSIKGDRS